MPSVGVKFLRFQKHYSMELWDIPAQTVPEHRAMYMENVHGVILVSDVTRPETFHGIPEILRGYSEATNEQKGGADTNDAADAKIATESGGAQGAGGGEGAAGGDGAAGVDAKTDGEAKEAGEAGGDSKEPERKAVLGMEDMLDPFDESEVSIGVPVVLIANKADLQTDENKMTEQDVNGYVQANDLTKGFLASVAMNTGLLEAFQCLLEAMVKQHIIGEDGEDGAGQDGQQGAAGAL